jgi:hypothetical protein
MCFLQLFLMKRGGEEIYVGPVGPNSSSLIEYFEVRRTKQLYLDVVTLFPDRSHRTFLLYVSSGN